MENSTDTYRSVALLSLASHALTLKLSHEEQKHHLYDSLTMATEGIFGGIILDSMEKGVLYPLVHMTSSPLAATPSRVCNASTFSNETISIQQGLYGELDEIKVELRLVDQAPPPENQASILMGFHDLSSPSFGCMMESRWKQWTGARNMYLNLSDDFCLDTIRFYRRVGTGSEPSFRYLVVATCDNVHRGNLDRMMDFVHRLRINQLGSYVSIYRRLAPGWSPSTSWESFTSLSPVASRQSPPFNHHLSDSGRDSLDSFTREHGI